MNSLTLFVTIDVKTYETSRIKINIKYEFQGLQRYVLEALFFSKIAF